MGTVTSLIYGPERPVRYHLRGLGNNQNGQIGTAGAPLKDADYVSGVSAGVDHSLAVSSLGEVFAWGYNAFGQLGNGAINSADVNAGITAPCIVRIREVGVDVVIARVAAGFGHSAAVSREGLLYTWGLGSDGQLGYELPASSSYLLTCGREICQLVPKVVLGVTAVEEVACGKNFTLILTSAKRVFATGSGCYGVLGNGRRSVQFGFRGIFEGLEGRKVSKIACGWSHCLAAVQGTGIFMWGNPYYDIDEEQEDIQTPILVLPVREEAISIACGQNHSAAVLTDLASRTTLYTWGSNSYFQLGYEEEELVKVPRPVPFLQSHEVRCVTCGWNYTAAVLGDGKLMGWGGNKYYQFGLDKSNEYPATVPVDSPVEVAVSGYSHLLLLTVPTVRKQKRTATSTTSMDRIYMDDFIVKE